MAESKEPTSWADSLKQYKQQKLVYEPEVMRKAMPCHVKSREAEQLFAKRDQELQKKLEMSNNKTHKKSLRAQSETRTYSLLTGEDSIPQNDSEFHVKKSSPHKSSVQSSVPYSIIEFQPKDPTIPKLQSPPHSNKKNESQFTFPEMFEPLSPKDSHQHKTDKPSILDWDQSRVFQAEKIHRSRKAVIPPHAETSSIGYNLTTHQITNEESYAQHQAREKLKQERSGQWKWNETKYKEAAEQEEDLANRRSLARHQGKIREAQYGRNRRTFDLINPAVPPS